MGSRQKLVIAVLSLVALALASFTLGVAVGGDRTEEAILGQDESVGIRAIRDAYNRIIESSVKPPSKEALTRAAIKAMVKVVKDSDPYAEFYTPEGYLSFQELTTGRFSGIGVWLKPNKGRLEIVSVLPESPALEAGLQKGDTIASVNGREVADMTIDEATARIKGPEGTDVEIGIERDGERIPFTITRAELELPNLRAHLARDDVGYILLSGFARGAGKQVRDEVDRLIDEGAEGIVLDLRDNGGGLFSEGVDVASVFVEEGEIVTYKERDQEPKVYTAEGDAFEKIPLVVLVNEGTASASEIVAGALQDTERAILVGTTTYGKGSVQQVFPLLDASALKLTIGGYLTPSGVEINGSGIEPDVEVGADVESPTAAARQQKRRAFEIIKGIILSSAGAQG
jgi:carboxyl-terminal processing protease